MQTFKEFLKNETNLYLEGEDNDGASRQFGYELIYPVYADEGGWALNNPVDLYFYQWAIERGLKHGRNLHNIDNDKLQAIKFKSIKSLTAPDAGPEFWEHKPDTRSNVEIKEDDLVPIGIGKDSKHPMILQWDKPNPGGCGYN